MSLKPKTHAAPIPAQVAAVLPVSALLQEGAPIRSLFDDLPESALVRNAQRAKSRNPLERKTQSSYLGLHRVARTTVSHERLLVLYQTSYQRAKQKEDAELAAGWLRAIARTERRLAASATPTKPCTEGVS